MAEPGREELVAEAYRRGILPPDMKEAYDEAARRGLLPGPPTTADQTQDLGKAVGSGIVHEALPQAMGVPAAIADLGGWNRHGFPDTEQSKEAVKNYIPEYEPKNLGEKIAKATGSFLPAAVVGPEALAPKAAASALSRFALKPAAEIARSAVAPAAAMEGSKDFYKNNPGAAGSTWVPTAATLIAPTLAGKAITPRAARDPEWLGYVKALEKDVNLGPGQKRGTEASHGLDTFLAEQPFSGTSPGDISRRQNREFTAGAMRRAGAPGGAASGENLTKLRQQHDTEINRLTSNYQMPFTAGAQRQMRQVEKDYLQANNQPVMASGAGGQNVIDKYITLIDSTTNGNKNWPGALSGPDYRSIRSQIGDDIQKADNKTAVALRGLQDVLDNTMEHTIQIQNPRDVGAFNDWRKNYQGYLALRKAAGSNTGSDVAQGVLSPEQVSRALADVAGEATLAETKTPLAKYSRAGEAVLGLHPDTERGKEVASNFKWPFLIGAGDLMSKSAGMGTEAGLLTGLGVGAAGAVVPQIPPSIMAALIHGAPTVNPIRAWQGNQILQRPVYSPLGAARIAPSRGLLAAEEAAKKKEKKSE